MRISTLAAVMLMLLMLLSAVSCGGEERGEEIGVSLPATTAEAVVVEEDIISPVPDVAPGGPPAGPAGAWTTTMGRIEFSSGEDGLISGTYPLGSLEGRPDGNVLDFTYSEGMLSGTGTFTFDDDFLTFEGIQKIGDVELVWNGARE